MDARTRIINLIENNPKIYPLIPYYLFDVFIKFCFNNYKYIDFQNINDYELELITLYKQVSFPHILHHVITLINEKYAGISDVQHRKLQYDIMNRISDMIDVDWSWYAIKSGELDKLFDCLLIDFKYI